MIRLFTLPLISAFALIFLFSSVKGKTTKDNPCVTNCKDEHKKCIQDSKKMNRQDRRKKIEECERLQKECKTNCEKQ